VVLDRRGAREGHELRTDGPYGIVRHPIYAGILGMPLGSAILDGFGQWTLALIGGGLLVLLRVRSEERLMTEVFRDEYERATGAVCRPDPVVAAALGRDGGALEQRDVRLRPLGQVRPAGARDHVPVDHVGALDVRPARRLDVGRERWEP
jgi:hypothetical protein